MVTKYGNRTSDTEISPCSYCGLKKMHRDRRSCPAYGKTSDLCQKTNHLLPYVEQTNLEIQRARTSTTQKEEEEIGLRKL